MEVNTVIHGNFLDNTLPDKCAQLIIADPPYFEVKGAFDFIWKDRDDYLADVEKWAKECKRLLADNGTLFWWGMDKKIAYSQIVLDKYFNLLNTLVWERPGLSSEWDTRRTFPERGMERCLMYDNAHEPNEWAKTGLEQIYSNPDCFKSIKEYVRSELKKSGLKISDIVKMTNTYASHYFADSQYAFITESHYKELQQTGFWQRPYEVLRQEYEVLRQEYEVLRQEYEVLRQEYEVLRQEYEVLRQEYEHKRRYFNNHMKLTDVLKFSHQPNEYDHPTKKPEKLTRSLIITCSRPNDLVLVPFAGSGTEVAMAAKEGRRFVGYDIEAKYAKMAQERANKHLNTPTLF